MDWFEFWNSDKIFSFIMKKNMGFFLKNSRDIFPLSENDIVLDIGCGAGPLADLLEVNVKEYQGVDTSSNYITFCKQKFKTQKRNHFKILDKNNYTNLSFLSTNHFTKILCMSVVQYYSSPKDIENLILQVKNISKKGAIFLIADIPVKASTAGDTLTMLKIAFYDGYILKAVLFLFKLKFSVYPKVRSSNRVLCFKVEELKDLIKKLDLNAEIIDQNLTLSGGRKHLLIKF